MRGVGLFFTGLSVAWVILDLAYGAFAGDAQMRTYTVRPGDTLSFIAVREVGSPIYGPLGSLIRVIEANDGVSEPNRIFPGTLIFIPVPDRRIAAITPEAPAVPVPSPDPTPAPTPIPTPTPSCHCADQGPVREVDQKSWIVIQPRFSFSTIESNDVTNNAKAKLASDLSYGAALQWVQQWSKAWESAIKFGFDKVSYSTTSNTKRFSTSDAILYQFELEMARRVGRARFSLGLGAFQSPFIRAISSTILTIDKVAIRQARAAFEYTFYQSETFRFSNELGFGYLLGASSDLYDVNSGWRVMDQITLEQLSGKHPLQGGLFYFRQAQDTSIAGQSIDGFGFFIGVKWSLGGSR